MITLANNFFHLETENTSYCFHVLPTGHLAHLYYGERIQVRPGDYSALQEKHTFIAGNALSYSKDFPNVGLENICLETSTIGKGDIRESFIELINHDGGNTNDFLFKSARILDDKKPLKGLPSSYGASSVLEVELYDPTYQLTLLLTYSVFYQTNIITRSSVLRNDSPHPVTLKRLMSAQLDLDTNDYTFTTFNGTWAREMGRNDKPCAHGIMVNDSKTGISSNRSNPFVMLWQNQANEDQGNCYGFNLIYSGNHYEAVDVNGYGKTRFLNGINPFGFSFIVPSNESFQSPEAVLSFSHQGFNGLSYNMHRFVQEHIVRGVWQHKVRPVLINSWEATYFNFNEAKLLKLAKAAKQVGVELFVLDDGWFGERNDDTSSLGDWDVNRKKLPGGLSGLAGKINALGLDFGIWVEPEMINENSRCYREHPDWAVRLPGMEPTLGRNQMILDLTKSAVRSYIIEKMSEVFSSANIRYVKWDMNRIFSDMYSSSLAPNCQQEFFHRYILGLYEVLEVLTARFPDILFESCASGGNRFDLGMLCYMPQVWASDNTDAMCRVHIQTGYSYGYPMSVIGAHVSSCPNHQTLRKTAIDTRFDVASFGLLGYEYNLGDLGSEELEIIAEQIAFYKKYREAMQFARFYRISNLQQGNECQWLAVSQDQSIAIGMHLHQQLIPNFSYAKFTTRGLKDDHLYHVQNRPITFNIKEFGDLINLISPVHIKQDGVAHNLIAKFKKMYSEKEDFTAHGGLLNRAGFKLKQAFSGTGYNEEIRFFPDYTSRLYIFEQVDTPAENEGDGE